MKMHIRTERPLCSVTTSSLAISFGKCYEKLLLPSSFRGLVSFPISRRQLPGFRGFFRLAHACSFMLKVSRNHPTCLEEPPHA